MVKLIVKIQRNLSKINSQDFARFDGILAESQYSGINSRNTVILPNLNMRICRIFKIPQDSTESWQNHNTQESIV